MEKENRNNYFGSRVQGLEFKHMGEDAGAMWALRAYGGLGFRVCGGGHRAHVSKWRVL